MNTWLKATLLLALVLTAGTRAYADGIVVYHLQEYGFTSPSHTSFGTDNYVGVPVSGSNTDTGTGYSASASASSGLDGLHASVNVSTDGTTPVTADAHAIMALDIVTSGTCGLGYGQICSSAGYVVWTITADGTMSAAGSGLTLGSLGAATNDSQGAWGTQSGGGSLTGGIQTWTLAPTPFISDGSSPCTDGSVGCSDSSIYVELALNGLAGEYSNGVPNGLPGTAILNYANTATITGDVYDANGNLLNQYFFGPSTTTAVPEPSSVMLLGIGTLGFLGTMGRKLLR